MSDSPLAEEPLAEEPLVGVIMGSDSDLPVMQGALDALTELGIAHEVRVVSAHRTPDVMFDYAQQAAARGLRVIIAGAGGAAHLPGMTASMTSLPVIGVPVPLQQLDGLDSLLSIVQMPDGVPVATVGVGKARNAGLLAARILGASDPELLARLDAQRAAMNAMVREKDAKLRDS
jgi:5-(carboxyamino)imidazole ribonucleotide mutase